jgi:hypothetical protein
MPHMSAGPDDSEGKMVAQFSAKTSATPEALVSIKIDVSAVYLFDAQLKEAIFHAPKVG